MVDQDRLSRARNQDISIQVELTSDEYVVRGTRGIPYEVDLREPSCTCPDWEKREPEGGCKHILAVKIERGDIGSVSSTKTHSQSSRYIPNWDRLARQTKERDNWTCQHCGKQGGPLGSAELHAHHRIPRSEGGDDTLDNLVTLCHSCHEDVHGHIIPTGGGSSSSSIKTTFHTDSGTQDDEPTIDEDAHHTEGHEPDENIDKQRSDSAPRCRLAI